ncbi:hypothetical protein THASP1DRAFT_28421 [Thamnocephalis sphaerospora]|uniref:Uncharacterized protein n=1 Tax=Thamnocephalis sphaerospora TaxID=78915 RepID=A0A4P9XUY9_9FUNG|nr:hypothetical protein THASP1DRAFT_28421 [Thamnocephalis sphaerospora]|eukprot:RKP09802.1 hypothetical protein THASP1DRAFT_28421 [Thamnocephalis sphaerospora]
MDSGDMPKIALDSVGDVHFLRQGLEETAAEALKEMQPELERRTAKLNEKQRAEVNRHMEAILKQWLNGVFKLAGSNMTVNELPYEEAMKTAKVKIKPFDHKLKEQTAALQVEFKRLILQIAERRKQLPSQVAKLVDGLLQMERALMDDTLAMVLSGEETPAQAGEEALPTTNVLLAPEKAHAEYAAAVTRLAELKRLLPAAAGRVERAATYAKDCLDQAEHTASKAALFDVGDASTSPAPSAEASPEETAQRQRTATTRAKSALVQKLRRGHRKRPYEDLF